MNLLDKRIIGLPILGKYTADSSTPSMKNTFREEKQIDSAESGNQYYNLQLSEKSNDASNSPTFYRIRAGESATITIHEEKKRNLEFEWIQNNKNKLSKLVGQWIALQGKRLVSHGTNFKIVKSQAKEKGFANPLIFFVSDEDGIV